MGNILGSVTDAIGLTDYEGEKKAQKRADASADRANALNKEQIDMSKEQVAFNREQYRDWQNIYGDVQENLGSYYKNLTPEKLVSLGLENQQKEYQQVKAAIDRDFAQRGLTNSGMNTFLNTTTAMQNATARASIRSNAEQLVNQEKLAFLGIGLGQGTALLGNTNNAAANVTNSFASGVTANTNLSANYLDAATKKGLANQEVVGDLVGTAAAVAYSDIRLKKDITFEKIKNGFNLYRFKYLNSSIEYIGVIAQEILSLVPEAVKNIDGYLAVDYKKLGLNLTKVN